MNLWTKLFLATPVVVCGLVMLDAMYQFSTTPSSFDEEDDRSNVIDFRKAAKRLRG